MRKIGTNGIFKIHDNGKIEGGDNLVKTDVSQAKTGTIMQNMVQCTQAQYDAITPDANTYYFIVG